MTGQSASTKQSMVLIATKGSARTARTRSACQHTVSTKTQNRPDIARDACSSGPRHKAPPSGSVEGHGPVRSPSTR